jgi:hypothetical protein
MIEGPRVTPELSANVATVWATANVDDDAQNNESNNGSNLDDGEYELCLTVSFDTVKRQCVKMSSKSRYVPKKIDSDNKDQEDGDPGVVVHLCIVPVFYRKGGGDNLQW